MEARISVMVLIALSNVDSAVCEPAEVVRSMVDTPAPAVAVACVKPAVKPAADRPAVELPAIVMPSLLEDANFTLERVIELAVAEFVAVADSPVTAGAAEAVAGLTTSTAMLRPSAAVKLTAPVVLSNEATTPVWLDLALIAEDICPPRAATLDVASRAPISTPLMKTVPVVIAVPAPVVVTVVPATLVA